MTIGVPLYSDWTLLPFKLVCFLIVPVRLTLLQPLSDLQQRLWINVGNTDSCLSKTAEVSFVDFFFFTKFHLIWCPYSYTFWRLKSTPHQCCGSTVNFGKSLWLEREESRDARQFPALWKGWWVGKHFSFSRMNRTLIGSFLLYCLLAEHLHALSLPLRILGFCCVLSTVPKITVMFVKIRIKRDLS